MYRMIRTCIKRCDHLIMNDYATSSEAKENIRKRLNIIFMQIKETKQHGKQTQ